MHDFQFVEHKIPQTKLDSSKGRYDISKSCVYFLFGISDQTGASVVYVGQAGVRKNDSSAGDDVIFYIKRSGADAKGKLTREGFVVLVGSKIRMDIFPSCPDYLKAERENSKDNINKN